MERKLYDLTVGQNVIAWSIGKIRNKEVMNICVEFQFDSEMDKHLLMQAVNMAALRNPNNQVRFTVKDKKVYQYFSEEAQEKIEYLEFENEDEYNKGIKKLCETPFPNNAIETQLYRLVVFKKPNGKLAILGVFAHLIYDTYSSVMMFKEIIDIYKALLKGNPLPPEAFSPMPAYEEEKKYFGSSRYQRDIKFYEEMYSTEPQYTCIAGKNAKTVKKNRKCGIVAALVNPSMSADSLVFPLDREFVNNINQYSLDHKVTSQNLYILALRTYLSVVCETDDVLFECAVNRRTTLNKRKAGGTFADSATLRTIFTNDISFNEALNITNDTISEVYKHVNLGIQTSSGILKAKYNTAPIEAYGGALFTYQAPLKLDDEIEYTIRRVPNGREWTILYISILPCNSSNDYVADYSWIKKAVSETNVRDFHEFMIKFIEEGIKDDSQSLKDIIRKAGK